MKNKTQSIIQNSRWTYASLLLAAGLTSAQEKAMPSQMGSQMPMMEMMGNFRQGWMAASDTLEQLLKTAQAALKSDDKAQMKAALELTEKNIVALKGNMSQFTGAMDMMGMMMGGGMMGGKAGDSALQAPEVKPASPGKTTPADKTDHEKHHPPK